MIHNLSPSRALPAGGRAVGCVRRGGGCKRSWGGGGVKGSRGGLLRCLMAGGLETGVGSIRRSCFN